MITNSLKAFFACTALGFAGTASASIITADSSWNGQGSVSAGGATISACNTANAGPCSSPGLIGIKNIPGVGPGAGVSGVRDNEIDWYGTAQGGNSEMLRFTFGTAGIVEELRIGLLFDGPEYGDVQERASFRVTYQNGAVSTFTLATVFGSSIGNWSGPSGSWVGSGMSSGGAGLWIGSNPFGSNAVSQIDLFAVAGTCAPGLICGNQSDFVFRSLRTTAVPEPTTLALLGAGLLLMGAAVRRHRAVVIGR